MANLRLGTQSWTYFPDWVGPFYPPKTQPPDALSFYAEVFDTVEVNTTFHAVPAESTVRGWYERTPPGFSFALKTPRAITHDARLELPICEPLLRDFLDAAYLLEDKLGPILVQLPPSFERTTSTRRALAAFLDLLDSPDSPDLKVVLELRNASWATAAVERELHSRNVAWCLVEGAQANARLLMYPADFSYVRWNRAGLDIEVFSEIIYDRSEALDWWAAALARAPSHVHTIYGYMSCEFAGHAPASLRMLQERLELSTVDPRTRWPQQVLF